MKDVILSLDMSTACTGFSILNASDKSIIEYGIVKPKVKGITKMKYPLKQLRVCQSMADQIFDIYCKANSEYNVVVIVIEEVNRGISRLGQKTLDILHGIVWAIFDELCLKIVYIDSDGRTGWRTSLGLKLDDADKLQNKEYKKLNKKLAKGTKKLPIINKKHLACRLVNRIYKTEFDVDENTNDNDIVDSIGLGYMYLTFKDL